MAYAKTEHWECNYLISNWAGEKEGKYGGICFGYLIKRHFVYMEQQVLVPMIRLNLEHGGKQIHFKRIDSMLCVEYVMRPKSSYSSLWVNGSYKTNFNSTASSRSDHRIMLGNIHDGGDTR